MVLSCCGIKTAVHLSLSPFLRDGSAVHTAEPFLRHSACAPCLPMWYHALCAQHSTASTTHQRKKIVRNFYRWYDRRAERRAKVTHNVGTIITKSLGQAFLKACRSRAAPWSLHRNGAKSPLPKISSARGSPMPAGIGRRGRIARASPMDEVGSMPTSSIKIEREQHYRLTQSGGTTWACTALTIIDLFIPWTVRWTVHGGTTSGQNASVASSRQSAAL